MDSVPDSSAGLPEDVPLVAVVRGAVVESAHRGRLAFCDPAGNVIDALGDPDAYVYARSSAKPLQALPLVLSGAADAFGLSDEELAVACSSHNAEAPHLAAVRSLLEKSGLTEKDLQSGAHPPMYAPEAGRMARSGEEPRPIHGNCSGKHAGMLAVCAHEGLDIGGYRRPDHPLQRRILEILIQVCGLREDEVLVAGDDCGVPTFALPLRNLATGFARFATGEGLSEEMAGAAERLRRAMRAEPFLVAGTGRLDTEVMGRTDLVCKSGAEALFAAASREGWGLALKVSDGGGGAVRPAALAALGRREVDVLGDEPIDVQKRDLHGELVGEIGPLV
jgi:L-asparaginase II